jgi:hypothetical protein
VTVARRACDEFDLHVVDALYDELDERARAELERHIEGCSRCASVYAGLRATRAAAVLPLEEPPADLEARILDAVALAMPADAREPSAPLPEGAREPLPAIIVPSRAPWHRRALRGLTWAATQAARPQLAIAATFFLVVGSSLLLFRASSKSPAATPAAADMVAAPAATAAPTAEAPPEPPMPAPAAPALVPKVAEGEGATAPPSSAVADVAAAPSASAPRAVAGAKPVEVQTADARGRARMAAPAAKPAAPAMGGTNPRATAAPKRTVGFAP